MTELNADKYSPKMTTMTDRYINLALVGHVSNGKTTLVNALTNVNTKRDSAEKKSGRTIRLGYANCMLWQCEKCNTYAATGQAVKAVTCTECSTEGSTVNMILIHKISFVDAPGHHEYVQTMTRGTAVVDGALIVTDARMNDLQVQTTEHLAILSILDVSNIVVVQNKIDLVDDEQRKLHYAMLKSELAGTSAEKSAIIPISAQSKLNLDTLLPWLDELCKVAKGKPITANKVFSVIRSFDVNKPNTPVENLKGGVLGGSVVGDVRFNIGDVLEIRPAGLTVTIQSIHSESDSCDSITTGGLYGIGTDLPSNATKADKLIGSLCGKKEDLPDVVTELTMHVTYVKLDSKTTEEKSTKVKIADGVKYQLMLGNHTVMAIAKKAASKKWRFILAEPICTTESTCLIYSLKPSALIAFGRLDSYVKPVDSVHVIRLQDKLEYESILPEVEDSEKKKSSVPVPKLARENRNILWLNIATFCERVRRPVNEVVKYIADETLIPVSLCDNGLRMYKAAINERKLTTLLKRFIIEHVACKQCKSIDTEKTHCLTCGATYKID